MPKVKGVLIARIIIQNEEKLEINAYIDESLEIRPIGIYHEN